MRKKYTANYKYVKGVPLEEVVQETQEQLADLKRERERQYGAVDKVSLCVRLLSDRFCFWGSCHGGHLDFISFFFFLDFGAI